MHLAYHIFLFAFRAKDNIMTRWCGFGAPFSIAAAMCMCLSTVGVVLPHAITTKASCSIFPSGDIAHLSPARFTTYKRPGNTSNRVLGDYEGFFKMLQEAGLRPSDDGVALAQYRPRCDDTCGNVIPSLCIPSPLGIAVHNTQHPALTTPPPPSVAAETQASHGMGSVAAGGGHARGST